MINFILYLLQIPVCIYLLSKNFRPKKFEDLPLCLQAGIVVAALFPVIGWSIIIVRFLFKNLNGLLDKVDK